MLLLPRVRKAPTARPLTCSQYGRDLHHCLFRRTTVQKETQPGRSFKQGGGYVIFRRSGKSIATAGICLDPGILRLDGMTLILGTTAISGNFLLKLTSTWICKVDKCSTTARYFSLSKDPDAMKRTLTNDSMELGHWSCHWPEAIPKAEQQIVVQGYTWQTEKTQTRGA